MNIKDLENYSDAWNNHDIDKIMNYMTNDCIFETGGGSEWTFIGTKKDGSRIEIDGCDLFTFENGKIKSKRSYVKNRS